MRHFEWTKVNQNAKNGPFWEAYGKKTVLPDSSLLIGQKMMENAKIETFKCDLLRYFQTL